MYWIHGWAWNVLKSYQNHIEMLILYQIHIHASCIHTHKTWHYTPKRAVFFRCIVTSIIVSSK